MGRRQTACFEGPFKGFQNYSHKFDPVEKKHIRLKKPTYDLLEKYGKIHKYLYLYREFLNIKCLFCRKIARIIFNDKKSFQLIVKSLSTPVENVYITKLQFKFQVKLVKIDLCSKSI